MSIERGAMQDQIGHVFIVISGFISVAIGYLFDVPPAVLWVAAFGAAGGVALSRTENKCFGFLWIAGGTVATGYAIPFLTQHWPDYSAKSLAFFVALILIAFRYQIIDGVRKIIAAGIDSAVKWIGRLGTALNKIGGSE